MLVRDIVIFCRRQRERVFELHFMCIEVLKRRLDGGGPHGLPPPPPRATAGGKVPLSLEAESVFWGSALLPGIEALYFCGVRIGSGNGERQFPLSLCGGRGAAGLRQLGTAALCGGRGCWRRKLSLVYLLVL